MSRLVDIAKYQGIAIEKEIVIDASEKYEQLKDEVRDKLNKEHAEIFLGSLFDLKVQEEAKDWIGVYVRDWVKKHGLIEKYPTIEELINAIAYDILDISILKPLVTKRGITDIYVDDEDDIYYDNYLEGRRPYEEKFKSREEMLFIMKKIAAAAGKNLSAEEPVVNAQIGNNRFNIVLGKDMKGIGEKHYINIRVHRDEQLTEEELIKSGLVTKEAADFIRDVARCKLIAGIIGGVVGTGKTTTLDTLVLANIDPWERQNIIQDENELRAKAKRPHQKIIELYTKPSSRKETEYTIARLIEDVGLRNKGDRTIVGEVRKGEDGDRLLYSFQTGHLGWTTIHADNAEGVVVRLGEMIRMYKPNVSWEEIENSIYRIIDIIVFIELIKINGVEKRRITEIVELHRNEKKNELRHIFKYDTKEGILKRVNKITDKLAEKMRKREINPERWLKLP